MTTGTEESDLLCSNDSLIQERGESECCGDDDDDDDDDADADVDGVQFQILWKCSKPP